VAGMVAGGELCGRTSNIQHPTLNIEPKRREGWRDVVGMVAGGALCGGTSNIQHRTLNIEPKRREGWRDVAGMVAGGELCGGTSNIQHPTSKGGTARDWGGVVEMVTGHGICIRASNIQRPKSDAQWHTLVPLRPVFPSMFRCWMFNVRCSMFCRKARPRPPSPQRRGTHPYSLPTPYSLFQYLGTLDRTGNTLCDTPLRDRTGVRTWTK
jgi:hypothetical protein